MNSYHTVANTHGGNWIKRNWPFALLSILISQGARAEQEVTFDLPARPAFETLLAYAKQSNLQVSFDPDLRMLTTAVKGTFDKKNALIRLLSGTGLEYEFRENDRVAIRAPAAKPAALPSPPPPPPTPVIREVRITAIGTHVLYRGAFGAKLIRLGQPEIQDSGVSTVPELLRRLTQNFGGGPSEDTSLFGAEAKSNPTFGQSPNLRGLGSRNTLILLNGYRIAPSGSDASYVDISLIPLSFIDHVDIMLEGASAIYGSDAVGGVVNFITKDNCAEKCFWGAQVLAETGGVTQGSQLEYRTSEGWGKDWGSGRLFTSFELYHRDALSASARSYASSDLSRFGGPNFDTIASNPGNLLVGGSYYPIPPGRNRTSLDFASLTVGAPNLSDLYLKSQILPMQDQRSFFGGLHQSLGTRLTVFGTLLWSDRHAIEAQGDQRLITPIPDSNSFLLNRPKDVVSVAYDLADDIGIWTIDARVRAINFTLGADLDLWADWKLSAAVAEVVENEYQKTLGTADPQALDTALQSTLNPFGSGPNIDPTTLTTIQVEPTYHSKSELREFYSSVHGHLLTTRAGEVHAALGTELRYQRFWSELSPPLMGSNLTRQVLAAFAEINLPVFGQDRTIPGMEEFQISGALRYEHSNDFGASTTPRFGAEWTPISGVRFLGSWGRSFRAPNLGDLDEHSNIAFIQRFPDASAPLGYSDALVVSGKNSRLKAERATTGMFGITIEPSLLPGFKAETSYYHTISEDRIQTTNFDLNILNDPDVQYVVTRNPGRTLRDGICLNKNNHFASSTLDGIATDCRATPIGSIVDLQALNLATLHLEAIDFCASYAFDSSWGRIGFDLESTYLLDYSLVNMPGAPRMSVLNTEHYPINLQAKGDVKWKWHDAWIRVGANYANSYRDSASPSARNIGPWLTFDLQLGYRLGERAGGFRDMNIIVNVENVGDRDPPFAVNRSAHLGYDQENGDPYGRTIKLTIQKKWGGPSRD